MSPRGVRQLHGMIVGSAVQDENVRAEDGRCIGLGLRYEGKHEIASQTFREITDRDVERAGVPAFANQHVDCFGAGRPECDPNVPVSRLVRRHLPTPYGVHLELSQMPQVVEIVDRVRFQLVRPQTGIAVKSHVGPRR